jgi:hypothetical protein
MTRTRSAIAATGLRKSFGEHLVLDGIDLDVAEGTIFALLGPNGIDSIPRRYGGDTWPRGTPRVSRRCGSTTCATPPAPCSPASSTR